MSEACAAIVERDDPHLYATALFAPEPARSRLMVLYAFDCELSRATRASKESLIPRMRLQWWRDMIEEAAAGKPPKAHEVAAPLSELITEGSLDPIDLDSLANARTHELDRPMDGDGYLVWHKSRFYCLVRAASRLLTHPKINPEYADPPRCSHAMSADYVIRNAVPMARAGTAPMQQDMMGADWASLARGNLTDNLRAKLKNLAQEGLDELRSARAEAKHHDPRIVPALLPLHRAERTLKIASDPNFTLGQLDHIDRPFDGLKLAWRAARGRW